MRAIVTGCNGYIGKALCKYIKDRYEDSFVIGIDIKQEENPYVDIFYNVEASNRAVIIGEVMNKQENKNINVFHLAAYASVPDSFRAPIVYYYNNLSQTISLFYNLLASGWKGNFVFSSTAGVYGPSDKPIKEEDALGPPHPYGRSKLMCEAILEEMSYRYNIPVTVFRYFNVIGANGDAGDHLNSSHVLQRLCDAAHNDTPFTIFGTDLATQDGTCVRDYIDVMDVCEAHIKVAEDNRTGETPYNVYNLGTTSGTSVRELVRNFQTVTGKTLVVQEEKPRPGDPAFLVADGQKFADHFEFNYNNHLQGVIESAWNYYTEKSGVKDGV